MSFCGEAVAVVGGWRFFKRRVFVPAVVAAICPLLFVYQAVAGDSVNVPVGSFVYDDLERLEVKGLINSSMLSTKPLSRMEAARLVREAEDAERSISYKATPGAVTPPVGRLRREFRHELAGYDGVFIKPVESLYIKYLHSNKTPYSPNVNNNGDILVKGANERAGFVFSAGLFKRLSFYLNPEYRANDNNSDARLLHGYLVFTAGGLEVEAGKDSMWWGPGYHGALLMSNNAEPLRMIKGTSSRPFALPWIFESFGLFKPTVFLARLENERDFPRAKLLGMRLDFKPTSRFQFALSRVFMFGGSGRRNLDFADWLNVLFAADKGEHEPGSPIDGDQILSVDASYVYVNDRLHSLPFSGLKLYTEWGAEDSSGRTKTPSGRANICGVFIDEPLWLKNADIRFEWANTARSARYGPAWYEHGVYTTGYRYFGRVIGHHMGPDAEDIFVRFQYHMDGGKKAALEYDTERSGIHAPQSTVRRWIALDLAYPLSSGTEFRFIAGDERTTEGENTVVSLNISFGF